MNETSSIEPTGASRTSSRASWATGAVAALGIALASVGSTEADAIGAVAIQQWDGGVAVGQVLGGDTITASDFAGQAGSMANNPQLNGSAWGHTGAWFSVFLGDSSGVTLSVQADDPNAFAPGLSVWAIGDTGPFDGGTTGFGNETSTAGFGTPHSFNAYGTVGSAGTLWLAEGQGGNVKELLGYAISGPSFLGTTGWGEQIVSGASDMRLTTDYATRVYGNVGPGFAELALQDVTAGWYAIYVGGTDNALAGGLYTLTVSSVPEPSTALMMVMGLGLLAARRARRT